MSEEDYAERRKRMVDEMDAIQEAHRAKITSKGIDLWIEADEFAKTGRLKR
jgi:hypothetical protein